ncbi:hypothetical protein ACFX13_001910 [Malus domestica]
MKGRLYCRRTPTESQEMLELQRFLGSLNIMLELTVLRSVKSRNKLAICHNFPFHLQAVFAKIMPTSSHLSLLHSRTHPTIDTGIRSCPSIKSVAAFLYIHRLRIFEVILDESSGIDFSLLQASNLRVVKQRSQLIIAVSFKLSIQDPFEVTAESPSTFYNVLNKLGLIPVQYEK